MLQQLLQELLRFFSTSTGHWTLLGVGSIVAFAVVYHKKRQIVDFTAEVIEEDSWFINRDDNHRLAIVVSLHLINKSGAPVRVWKCKLSGYTPRENPPRFVLNGYDRTIELEHPKYDHFYAGQEYVVNPYSEQRMWAYYESRLVTLSNLLRAPIVIKDANRKRKSVPVAIPRNEQQIELYNEAARKW